MAFVRPIVEVFQTFTDVVVSATAPDLGCCLVGPAFFIQDYPADASDIYVSAFVKDTFDADAASNTVDGTSAGRPDVGDFVVLTNPPNHISGGVLDEDSVQVIFDDAYIQLDSGIDGAMAAGSSQFTSAGADFVTNKVAVGDRVILTKSSDTEQSIKTVTAVTDLNTLELSSTNKDSVAGYTSEWIGTANIQWRVEHLLQDQEVDSAYYTIVGQQITLTVPGGGILLTYQSLTWTVNYAKLYVGYRELRTDLQDVAEITTAASITSTLGRVDERNPLAVGAQIALANASTVIQVFGVPTDNLAGQQSARDAMTTRDDIYAIVPLTDALSASDWITVIGMWKTHVTSFDDPDPSKFRVVLGSYDTLPVYKNSAPASPVGTTVAVGAVYDVFVDPHADAEFVSNAVSTSHVLDIARSATILTLSTWGGGEGETIFKAAYTGSELLGAIGEKRLRLSAAAAGAVAGQAGDYVVRNPIVLGEGVTPRVSVLTGLTESASGTVLRLTGSTGDFSGVAVGDVAALSDASVVDDDGYYVEAIDGVNSAYIDVTIPHGGSVGITTKVRTYRPSDLSGFVVAGCTIEATPRTITKAAAFTNAAVGDMAVVLMSQSGTETPGNVGVWSIAAIASNGNTITLAGTGALVNDAGADVNVAVYPAVTSRGGASITTRARLDKLVDNSATFLTDVVAGELIEIPYPADTSALAWDTTTTQWEIDSVVNDNELLPSLGTLEELAPDTFIVGFTGDCAYRIAIELTKASQVTELNATISSSSDKRLVMTWPNECYVSGVQNELTEVQSKQKGQYLSCAVGGMTAGLPSHQGLTNIGITGISQIFNSNFYFTNDQLTDLRDGGWYVFVQDSSASLPYTIHEVTTDVSAYAFGEYMNIKNFDYIATYLKRIMQQFPGEYNINTQTKEMMRASLNAGMDFLKLRSFPKIGAPLLSGSIDSLEVSESDVDRINAYIDLGLPKVLNQIGLYLRA
jgi:hypothetical protein